MGHHKKKKKHKSKHRRRSSSDSNSPDEQIKKQKFIGPCLPTFPPPAEPPASTSTEGDSYGPQLPPNLCKPKAKAVTVQPQPLPNREDDDGDVIGPLPANLQNSSDTQQALDERAEILKFQFLLQGIGNDDEVTRRETWMTELPPEKANSFGLGPRKFRTSAITGDPKNRSLWTETPLDKDKPQQETVQDTDKFEELIVSQRNKMMDEIVEKTKAKKEKKSLLDIHREKLKKKKHKHKDEKQERRPFDRDVDLEVNKFDDAQKKSMLKKAQLLDNRFAHGRSKYL